MCYHSSVGIDGYRVPFPNAGRRAFTGAAFFVSAQVGGPAIMIYTMQQLETGQRVRRLGKRFYKTYEWIQMRDRILARDHYACVECRKGGRYTRADTVHHIRHLRDAPELALTPENLESVCRDCHARIHDARKREFVNRERW